MATILSRSQCVNFIQISYFFRELDLWKGNSEFKLTQKPYTIPDVLWLTFVSNNISGEKFIDDTQDINR